MRSLSISILAAILWSLGGAAGCAADTSADPANEAAASDAAELKSGGITLHNNGDRTVGTGPLSLHVTAAAGNVTAKVTDSPLANCTITHNASASTTKKTVFDIAIDYQDDDGWNGCTIEFKATGYKSRLDVGETVGD
jgi:hypothetical protein